MSSDLQGLAGSALKAEKPKVRRDSPPARIVVRMDDQRKQKSLGQYFTPYPVAALMVALSSKQSDARVLEPSAGQGVFLDALLARGYSQLEACELDASIVDERHRGRVAIGSFVGATYTEDFDLIIGNPPYVRWKNMTSEQQAELIANPFWDEHFNSLCDLLFFFIARSIELLADGGELIFITPAFWTNTMHAQAVRRYMTEHGSLDLWIRFGEAAVFPKVGSSIVVFRFVKGRPADTVDVYDYTGPRRVELPDGDAEAVLHASGLFHHSVHPHPLGEEPWVFAEQDVHDQLQVLERACTDESGHLAQLGDVAEIANGMVSGLDQAFRLVDETEASDGFIPVIKARDLATLKHKTSSRYLFLEHVADEATLERDYPALYRQLQPFRERLQQRYDYDRGTQYWQWSFLRSRAFFEQPQPMVFIPCKERVTNKSRLRLCVAPAGTYPTQDMTALRLHEEVREAPEYVVGLLSSSEWFAWIRHKGLLKGGVAEFSERPLSRVPVRLISWDEPEEVRLHDCIVALVRTYTIGDEVDLLRLDNYVSDLLAR